MSAPVAFYLCGRCGVVIGIPMPIWEDPKRPRECAGCRRSGAHREALMEHISWASLTGYVDRVGILPPGSRVSPGSAS